MILLVLALSVTSQSAPPAAPQAKPEPPDPGAIRVMIRMDVPEIPVSEERDALEQLGSAIRSGGPGPQPKLDSEHADGWFLVSSPLQVRVVSTYRIPKSEPARELVQVRILEGAAKGRVAWTFGTFLNAPAGLERLLAVPYEERSRQWAAYLAKLKPGKQPTAADQARALAEKRRQKKAARYRATLAREAADAKAEAEAQARARKEYLEELPYVVQAQGQMLQRLSQMESNRIQSERNQILQRFMTGAGYWGPRPVFPPAAGGTTTPGADAAAAGDASGAGAPPADGGP